ncbi:MAG: hypothetical protein U0U46_07820 [Saprospiraceae bacterium]|nr:hypothetical protein [Saprospiraceae bacterium]
MPYSIDKKRTIGYPPESLLTFFRHSFEWIDNLNFALSPSDCLDHAEEYIAVAKKIFLEMGWHGDGEIQLIWIPPFMFDGLRTARFTEGIVVWHVKQQEDGISWLLSPFDFSSCDRQWVVFNADEPEIRKAGEEQAEQLHRKISIIV